MRRRQRNGSAALRDDRLPVSWLSPLPSPMPLRYALALVLLLSSAASAQVPTEWAPREDANANLPSTIRAYETTTPGAAAWYVRADLSDPSLRLLAELSPNGTETVSSFAARMGALVTLNGGYFGGDQSYSLVLEGGQAVSSNIGALTRNGQTYYPTRGAFGLTTGQSLDVAWVYDVDGVQMAYDVPNANEEGETPEPRPTASFPAGARPWDVQTAIGGGPVLVENGQVRLTWEAEVFFGGSGVDTTSARARTAVGRDLQGNMLILAAAEAPGLTLRQLAEVMVSLGAVEAVNLDGGGSTNLIVGDLPLYRTSRPVASALMIVPHQSAEGLVYDTGDPLSGYREEGAWFESANGPYFGSTRSRLLEVGTEGRAVFVPQGLAGGPYSYSVEAWWVPASNRATDTPFVAYFGGAVVDTFRVDQSDPSTAGQWNAVSDWIISVDSIAVTAEATSGPGATFVNVDAIRLEAYFLPSTEPGPADALRLRLAPNPVRDRLAATLRLSEPGEVHATLLDALGRAVRQRTARMGSGDGRVEMDVRGLAPGVYTLRVRTAEGTASARATLIR